VEVAIVSILKTLWRERTGGDVPGEERDYGSLAEFVASLEAADVPEAR